jgi:hypothetical protein
MSAATAAEENEREAKSARGLTRERRGDIAVPFQLDRNP